jgi:hypothetical protein
LLNWESLKGEFAKIEQEFDLVSNISYHVSPRYHMLSPLSTSFFNWENIFLPALNPTTTLITLSFRRKPESSQSDTEDGYFGPMVIGGLLDAGSSPA